MTHGCRVGRLMSWDWENMGFFSGEKRVLSGEKKKKKVSRIHLLPRLEAPAGKPQPGPQQGFLASASLVSWAG